MVVDLRLIKRTFSIASFFLAMLNIYTLVNVNAICLTAMMFLISNFLTIMGYKLKKKYKSNNYFIYLCRFFETFIILAFFFILFYSEFNNLISLIYFKMVIMLILFIATCYFIFITFFIMNDEEFEETIRSSVKIFAESFDEATKKLSSEINEAGGWSEFIKTPTGREFANAVKNNSKSKTPTDHRHKKKRGK